MRPYGRVHTAFWTSADVHGFSEDARTMALYLLTSPHTTIIGAFRLPDGYVCEDLRWSAKRVEEGFGELFVKGFANRCGTTKWVWISKFLDWNSPENPNQWKAARKCVAQIPDGCAWKAAFLRVFAIAAGDPVPPDENPSGTVAEPFRNLELERELELERKLERERENPMSAAPTAPDVPRGTVGQDIEAFAADLGTNPDDAQAVFDHWRDTWQHPKAALDEKRRKLIRARLRDYSAADLCRAITGYRNSPHHCGQNDRATVYDDLGLFLRDAAHVDAGLRFAAAPPRADQSALTRRNVAAVADWVPPEMREAKHAAG